MARLVTSDGVQVNLFLDLDSNNTGEGTLLYGPKSQPNMDFIVQGFKDFRTNTEFNNKNRLVFHCDHQITVYISSITGGNYPTSSNPYSAAPDTKLYYVGNDLVLSKTGTKIHRIDLFKSASTNFDNLQTQILTNDDDISQLNTGLTNLINNGGGGGSGNSTPVESMFPLSPEISNASSCFFYAQHGSSGRVDPVGSLSFDYSNATSAEKSVISNLPIGVIVRIGTTQYNGSTKPSATGLVSKIDSTNERIQITLSGSRGFSSNNLSSIYDTDKYFPNVNYKLYDYRDYTYDYTYNNITSSPITSSLTFHDGNDYAGVANCQEKWMKVEAGVDNGLYKDWGNVNSLGIAKFPANLSNIPAEATHIVFQVTGWGVVETQIYNRMNFNQYKPQTQVPDFTEICYRSSHSSGSDYTEFQADYETSTIIIPNNSYFNIYNSYYLSKFNGRTESITFKPVGYFIEGSSSAGVSSLNGQTGDVTLDTYTKTEVDNLVSSSGGSNVEMFYASTNWTKPAGVTRLEIILVGGGAAGGLQSGSTTGFYHLINGMHGGDTSITFPDATYVAYGGNAKYPQATASIGSAIGLAHHGESGFLGKPPRTYPSNYESTLPTGVQDGHGSYVYGGGFYPGGDSSNPDGDPYGWSGGAAMIPDGINFVTNGGDGGGSAYASLGGSGHVQSSPYGYSGKGNIGGGAGGGRHSNSNSYGLYGPGGGGAGAGGGGLFLRTSDYNTGTFAGGTTYTYSYRPGGSAGQIFEFDKIVSSAEQSYSIVIGAGGDAVTGLSGTYPYCVGGGGGQGIVIIKY